MLGLIRKNELKKILDYIENAERNDCDGTEKQRIWLSGSLEAIYAIAGYFGIELNNMKKDDNLMANFMSTVGELNDAIETLKTECASHKECKYCDFHKIDGCKLRDNTPENWETIKNNGYESVDTAHGSWESIDADEEGFASDYKCSVCKREIGLSYCDINCDYKYCPYCGAMMED